MRAASARMVGRCSARQAAPIAASAAGSVSAVTDGRAGAGRAGWSVLGGGHAVAFPVTSRVVAEEFVVAVQRWCCAGGVGAGGRGQRAAGQRAGHRRPVVGAVRWRRASTATRSGSWRPELERGGHPGEDRVRGHGAVQQQRTDQRPGARARHPARAARRPRTPGGSSVNAPLARAAASAVAPASAPGLRARISR